MLKRKPVNILDPHMDPRRLIFMLVWPTIIEEFMSILVNYVDTAMVGSLGVYATASVAVSSPIVGMMVGIMMGLASGFGITFSRMIGEGRKADALKVMQQSIYYALAMGGFMTFLFVVVFPDNLPRWMNAQPDIWETSGQYIRWFGYSRLFLVVNILCSQFLRGQGDTRTPMIANLSSNISNAIMNFLFIFPTRQITVFGLSFTMFGLGKGVAGAAMATSLANLIACSISVSRIFSPHNIVQFSFKGMEKPDFHMYKLTFSMGVPVALERSVTSFGMMMCSRLLAGISNQVVAAHSLANTAESICYMSVMGFGMAASTIVAQWLGADDPDRAMMLSTKCLKYAAIVSTCATIVLFIGAPYILDIFTNDAQVIAMGTFALRIQCAVEVIEALAMTISGILRGAGDVRITSLASIIGMWCVRVLLANILIRGFGFGLNGVWIPMALDWVCRFSILFTRYRSGKWRGAWAKNTGK